MNRLYHSRAFFSTRFFHIVNFLLLKSSNSFRLTGFFVSEYMSAHVMPYRLCSGAALYIIAGNCRSLAQAVSELCLYGHEKLLSRDTQGPIVDTQTAECDAALKALHCRSGKSVPFAAVTQPIGAEVAQRRCAQHIQHQMVAVGADRFIQRPFSAAIHRVFQQ